MPSTFTPALLLEKPAPGEQKDTWGLTLDANFDKIDAGIAWQNISQAVFTTPQTSVVFPLVGYSRFRLVWQDLSPSIPAPLFLRFSVDGGTTFLSTNEYTVIQRFASGSGQAVQTLTGGIDAPLSPPGAAGALFGSLEFQSFGNKMGRAECFGFDNASAPFLAETGTYCTNATTATHVQLGFAFTVCASGRVKLLGTV